MPSVASSKTFGEFTGDITILTGGATVTSAVTLDAFTARTEMIGTDVYRGTATSWGHNFWDDRRFGVEDGFWNDGCR